MARRRPRRHPPPPGPDDRRALPRVLERFPDAVYIVLGTTHPHVRAHHGESYRDMLRAAVRQLGLSDHVRFHNRFVPLEELCNHLGAADLYVTPYMGETQIVSGTLAYALGSGWACCSPAAPCSATPASSRTHGTSRSAASATS